MKIETPPPKKRRHQESGIVSDNEGNVTYGYKVIWLQEIIDRKGIIVALKVVPIQVHDMEAARSLVDEFAFEKGSLLIADRAKKTGMSQLILNPSDSVIGYELIPMACRPPRQRAVSPQTHILRIVSGHNF